MFSLGDTLSAISAAAPQLDPNGKSAPYLAIGQALINSRTSPVTPGVPNTKRVVDPAVSVAAVQQPGVWGWLKARPAVLIGGIVGLILVVWFLKRKA